jgi:hypothetical protein
MSIIHTDLHKLNNKLVSVEECEGMNLNTPKWTFILGIGISMDSQIFKGFSKGVKIH